MVLDYAAGVARGLGRFGKDLRYQRDAFSEKSVHPDSAFAVFALSGLALGAFVFIDVYAASRIITVVADLTSVNLVWYAVGVLALVAHFPVVYWAAYTLFDLSYGLAEQYSVPIAAGKKKEMDGSKEKTDI